jgi:hypothetical protein
MDDQEAKREGGRGLAICSRSMAILIIIIGVFSLPFILITLAVVEDKLFHTSHIINFGRAVGIFEPLNALFRKMSWIWGY